MIKQKVFKGFLTGIITTIFGVTLCTFIIAKIKSTGFDQTFTSFQHDGKLWMLLALGAIPNLLVFFLLLKRNLEYQARGVVMATLLVAFITYGIYFF